MMETKRMWKPQLIRYWLAIVYVTSYAVYAGQRDPVHHYPRNAVIPSERWERKRKKENERGCVFELKRQKGIETRNELRFYLCYLLVAEKG